MAQEKYSPTVTAAFRVDQKWFEKNGGEFGNGVNPNSWYDDDGYDSYGYNEHGIDREGKSEGCYLTDSLREGNYDMYFDIESEWYYNGVKPVRYY